MYGFWTNLNRVAFLLCCAVLFLVRFCFETDSRSPRHRLFMRPKTDVSTTSVDAVAPIGGAAHWKVRMGESLWERPLSLSLSQKLFSVSFVYPNIFIEKIWACSWYFDLRFFLLLFLFDGCRRWNWCLSDANMRSSWVKHWRVRSPD